MLPALARFLKALSKGGTLVSYSQVVHEPGEVIPGEGILFSLTDRLEISFSEFE